MDIPLVTGKEMVVLHRFQPVFLPLDVLDVELILTELLYMDEIPDSIAINEAVEIAKKYNDEKSAKFVNGVLSSVYKSKESTNE